MNFLACFASLLHRARRMAVLGALIPALAAPSAAGILHGPVTNPANGHTYYLLTQSTWTAAEAEALGGHLATINDTAENQWLLTTFGNHGGSAKGLWIGLHTPHNCVPLHIFSSITFRSHQNPRKITRLHYL